MTSPKRRVKEIHFDYTQAAPVGKNYAYFIVGQDFEGAKVTEILRTGKTSCEVIMSDNSMIEINNVTYFRIKKDGTIKQNNTASVH